MKQLYKYFTFLIMLVAALAPTVASANYTLSGRSGTTRDDAIGNCPAQKIITTGAGTIQTIVINHTNNGGSTGYNINLDVEADSSGHPSGTSLSHATVPVASYGGAVTYTLGTPLSLNASSNYWLVFSSDNPTDSNTNLVANLGATGGAYDTQRYDVIGTGYPTCPTETTGWIANDTTGFTYDYTVVVTTTSFDFGSWFGF